MWMRCTPMGGHTARDTGAEAGGRVGVGVGGGGWGYAPYVYRQSFITVDLYDAASRMPIWHASAEQSLSGLTGDAAAQRIRAAVNAIFLKFPK
jgi:hypothetical protein